MPIESMPDTISTPVVRVAPQRALPAPTMNDRLAEWQGRGEAFIRERPMAALLLAVGAGLLAGRLFRTLLKTKRKATLDTPD